MSGMRIDFSEVEDSFEVLPAGRYEFIVERAEMRESKSSDNPYVNFELKVTEEDYEDRRVWIGASTSKGGLSRLKECFVALGAIDPDDEIDLEWDEEVDMTPKEGPLVTNPELEGLVGIVSTVNSVYENRERQDAWRSDILPIDADEPAEEEEKPKGKSKAKGKAKGKGAKRKLR